MKSFFEIRPHPTFRLIIFMAVLFSLLSINYINNGFQILKTNFETSRSNKGPYQFTLAKPEPLHFEVDYSMEEDENKKNAIILEVNGEWKKVIQTQTAFYAERIRFTVPQSRFKSGTNQLTVEFESGEYPVFSLNVKLKNYLGISPNFPRAYLIDDARPDDHYGIQKIGVLTGNFLVLFLFSFVSFVAFLKIANLILPSHSWDTPGKAILLLIIPSLIPVVVNIYSIATPVKIALPLVSLMGVCLIYFFLAVGVLLAVSWKNVIYPVLAVVLMTFGVTEISMRLYNLLNPSHIFYNKSYNRYRGKQLTYYHGFLLNSKGFHDIEHPIEKPKNSFRTVALGDSFAFGVVPYQYNFLTQLEDKLKQDHPANEVVNMGIGATGVRSYLSVLANEGVSYNPDMVIVNLFIGNDFEIHERKKIYEYSFVATFIHYVYQFSKYYTQQLTQPGGSSSLPSLKEQPTPVPPSLNYRDDQPTFDPDSFMRIEVTRSVIFRKDNTGFPGLGQRVLYYLKEMRNLCLEKGIKFWVVIIPDEVQVNFSLQRKVVQAHGISPDDFDFMGPNKWLKKYLSQAKIHSIDLTESFVEHSKNTWLYKPRDTHWNIAGNQLAADILYRKLFEK